MDKVKKFDEELKNTYQDVFFFTKLISYMFFIMGILLMMIPFDPEDGMRLFMLQGTVTGTVGVRQYLQAYLFVKEGDKMVSIYKKMAFLPVTKEEVRKVRCGYLNYICVRVGIAMFVVQQAASLLNHSFGIVSVLFAVCIIALMWGFGWIFIYTCR